MTLERVTYPTTHGVFIFDATWVNDSSILCSLEYYAYCPEDEAAAQTEIKTKAVPTEEVALGVLNLWYAEEVARSFAPYSLTKHAVRQRDLLDDQHKQLLKYLGEKTLAEVRTSVDQ